MRFCLFLSLSAICSFAFTGCGGGGGSSDAYANADIDKKYHWTDGPALDRLPDNFKIFIVLPTALDVDDQNNYSTIEATGSSAMPRSPHREYNASYTYKKISPTEGEYVLTYQVPYSSNYSVDIFEITCILVFNDDSKTGNISRWTGVDYFYRTYSGGGNWTYNRQSGTMGTFALEY